MALRKGQIVRIEFLDHCLNLSRPLPFVAYGRIAHVTKKAISLDSWHHRGKKPYDNVNDERKTIVRAAITKITQLKEVGEEE